MTSPLAAEALAAVLAVARRRGADEAVVAQCQLDLDAGRMTGRVVAHIGPDTTIGELAEHCRKQLAELGSGTDAAQPRGAAPSALEFVALAQPQPAGTRVRAEAGLGPVVTARFIQGQMSFRLSGDAAEQPYPGDWARQYECARAALAAQPGTAVDAIRLTTDDDLTMISSFCGTGDSPERESSITDLVSAHVRGRPDSIAVSCGDQTLSYAQLGERAERVAHAVSQATAGRCAVVGVLIEPSPDLVVTLLGILLAGCGYLALEPSDPAAHYTRVLHLADVEVVLLQRHLDHLLPDDLGVRRLMTDEIAFSQAVGGPLPPVTPEHIAYVSLTSGSTGEPKAVAVPHRGVVRLLRQPDWMVIDSSDVFLHISPVAFDASTIEIWGPLLNGGRLVIYPDRPIDLPGLANAIVAGQISVLLLPTGLFHQMINDHLAAFAALRHVLTGGDVASASLVRRLMNAWPRLLVTNGYGPTENTSYSACWTSAIAPAGDNVPIGKPIKGTRVAVLDSSLQPVPPGIWGELYVSGDGLGHGYLARAARTAERFVADPYSVRRGARMYRTGDLVRWTDSGDLDFLRRSDRQVKVGGFRVEPDHIEEELMRNPDVRQAMVVPVRNSQGGYRLRAYVVPRSHPDAGLARQLRSYLVTALPPYMIPSTFVISADLPLTRNGKLDRQALPAAQVPATRSLANDYVPPRSPLEEDIAQLWSEILQAEHIGIHDSFFELGGYSLLAAELLRSLKNEFDLTISAEAFYRSPTIAGLVAHLEDAS